MVMSTINTTELLNTTEAAKIIGGVTAKSVCQYCWNIEQGKTPFIKGMRFGRSWLIPKKELDIFLKTRNSPGRPPSNG
jgi:hypothetical protein